MVGCAVVLLSILGVVQWRARERFHLHGWQQDVPAPVMDTALRASEPLPDLDGLCVNTALESYPDGELSTAVGWVTAGGYTWIRQKFAWAAIESKAGVYDWSAWDARMPILLEKNVGLWAVLDQAPQWAGSPPDPHAFAAFAGAFAERYGDGVRYYQIWHNINLGDAWGGYADPYAYTAMLALASEAIREADPDARIILGSLAPNSEQGNRNFAEDLFLDMLYAAGAGPFFDIVSVQPYGFDTGPDDRQVQRDILNFSRPLLVRDVLHTHADDAKAIWASHFGWNHLPPDWEDTPSIWGSVNAQMQAVYTTEAVERAVREWPWMGLMCVNILQPRPVDELQPVPDAETHWGFSLIGPEGEPRPVYTAVQSWAQQRRGALPGVYPAETHYARYDGAWTLGPQGADIGQSGDRVTFTFTGTGAAVTVRKGPYRAFLFATVDGQPASALPKDRDGHTYIVLYDPLAAVTTVMLADGLPYGTHTATLVAERGWGQWALADWRVISQYNRSWMLFGYVLFAGLGCIGVTLVVRTRAAFDGTGLYQTLMRLWERSTFLIKAVLSIGSSALTLFAAWHMLAGDGVFRRLGDHSDWLALLLSTSLFYFSHWFTLTLLAGTVMAVIVFLRPKLGLALTLCAAPLYLHPLSLLGKSFSLAELVLLPTLAGVVLRIIQERQPFSVKKVWHSLPRHLVVPLFVFLIYSLLTSFTADFRREALREWRLAVLEPFLFFIALITLRLNQRQRLTMLHALVASACLVAIVGLVQYFWLGDVITAEGGLQRLRSIYGSPNNVGLYLGRVVPFLLASVVVLEPGRRTPDWRHRLVYGLALIPILLALALSFSRGAILLGIPAVLLVLGLLLGKTWRRLTLIALLAGVVALVPLMRLPRFAGLFDLSSGTTSFRLSLWHSSLQMIGDHPMLGVGLDNFLYAYRTRYVLPTAWEEFNLSHPHNVLLDFSTRLGIPGLIIFLWMQSAFWRQVIAQLQTKASVKRMLTLGVIGSMVNFLAHGLVDASYFVIDLAYVYMFSFAIAAWLQDWAPESEETDE